MWVGLPAADGPVEIVDGVIDLTDYPAALIVLDLITGGTGKALGGVIGMMSGHAWRVPMTTERSLPSRLPYQCVTTTQVVPVHISSIAPIVGCTAPQSS
jgi:hypothetical protein